MCLYHLEHKVSADCEPAFLRAQEITCDSFITFLMAGHGAMVMLFSAHIGMVRVDKRPSRTKLIGVIPRKDEAQLPKL